MGNRAVIALESMPTVGIYVHWNGGEESVEAFLEEAKRRKLRSPESDPTYAFGRLVQLIGDFFSQGEEPSYETSLGVGPLDMLDADNGDNGTYWIADDWTIARREHASPYSRTTSEQRAKYLKGIRETFLAIHEGFKAV